MAAPVPVCQRVAGNKSSIATHPKLFTPIIFGPCPWPRAS